MRYLCLIRFDEAMFAALPAATQNDLNARHMDLNEELRASGHFLAAEALEPARAASVVKVRDGRMSYVDGPYTESKEMIAGFYLLEAADLEEARALAARLPAATIGTVEVRPARQLLIEGREPRWGG